MRKRDRLIKEIQSATRVSHEIVLFGEWVAAPESCYREARIMGELLLENTHWLPKERRHYANSLARECVEAGKGRAYSPLAAAGLAFAARRVLESVLQGF